MRNKKSITCLIVASIVLVPISGSRCFASLEDWSTWGVDNTFYGYLTTEEIYYEDTTGTLIDAAGLTAANEWDDPSTMIEYWVTAVYDGDPFPAHLHYKYVFTETTSGTLSHFNLEVSKPGDGGLSGFESGYPDFFGPPSQPADEEGWVTTGSGEPGMPHDLWALKFEENMTDGTWTLEFDSLRVPEWGDFYVKDGGGTGDEAVYAYNSGFAYHPPEDYLDTYGYIARPDAEYVPIPASVIIGLLGMGIAGIKLRKFA